MLLRYICNINIMTQVAAHLSVICNTWKQETSKENKNCIIKSSQLHVFALSLKLSLLSNYISATKIQDDVENSIMRQQQNWNWLSWVLRCKLICDYQWKVKAYQLMWNLPAIYLHHICDCNIFVQQIWQNICISSRMDYTSYTQLNVQCLIASAGLWKTCCL